VGGCGYVPTLGPKQVCEAGLVSMMSPYLVPITRVRKPAMPLREGLMCARSNVYVKDVMLFQKNDFDVETDFSN
jgi:hypothetical protein